MQNAHAFVAELNKQFLAAQPDKVSRPFFSVKSGSVYDKIVYCDAWQSRSGAGGAVYCFVNPEGDVFKAASYKAPANGARAHLRDLTPEFIARTIVAHGYASTGWLYR